MTPAHPRRAAACACVVLAALIAIACSRERRYAVLNFLFDGVPPPREAPDRSASTGDRATTPTLMGTLPVIGRYATTPTSGSLHRGMSREDCLVCHDRRKGLEPSVEIKRAFCDRCHGEQRRRENWNHGPINLGDCAPCHRGGHTAPAEPLLDEKIPDLCFYCHQEGEEDEARFHRAGTLRVDLRNCITCHDPHRVF